MHTWYCDKRETFLSKALLWRRAIVTISSSAGHESDSFKWRPDLQNFWKIVSQLLLLTFSKYFSRQPQSDQYHVLAASRISSANSAARFYSGVCLNVMYLVKYSSCYWAFWPLVSLEENKQAELTELTVVVAVPHISRVNLYQSQLGYFLVTAHPVHCNCFDQFHFHRCLTEKEFNL